MSAGLLCRWTKSLYDDDDDDDVFENLILLFSNVAEMNLTPLNFIRCVCEKHRSSIHFDVSQQQRRIDLLTITDPANLTAKGKQKVVFITARVHPGETPSSHVCQGLFGRIFVFSIIGGTCLVHALETFELNRYHADRCRSCEMDHTHR